MPPLTWKGWVAAGGECSKAGWRCWTAAVRDYAREHDLSSYILLYPESAADLAGAPSERTRRSLALALEHRP
jgi:hypothetical protein